VHLPHDGGDVPARHCCTFLEILAIILPPLGVFVRFNCYRVSPLPLARGLNPCFDALCARLLAGDLLIDLVGCRLRHRISSASSDGGAGCVVATRAGSWVNCILSCIDFYTWWNCDFRRCWVICMLRCIGFHTRIYIFFAVLILACISLYAWINCNMVCIFIHCH
jgi:hypothetical protein